MTIWGWLVISVSGVFLATSIVRMTQYANVHGMFTNRCNAQLLIVGYATGISYVIGNQEIQQILHSYVSFLPIPIVLIMWLICTILLVSFLYLHTVQTCTTLSVSKSIMRFLVVASVCGIGFIAILYHHISFFDLQVISSLISAVIGTISAIYLSGLMQGVLSEEELAIRRVQFRWFVLEITTLFIATLFLAVDSGYKLWSDGDTIYTVPYIICTLLQTISIIALHMLNEGNFSQLVEYPTKLRTYYKLKQLYENIQQQVQHPDVYNIPIPDKPSPSNIDNLSYHIVIMISDRYWQLREDITLRHQIERIINTDISINTISGKLAALVQ